MQLTCPLSGSSNCLDRSSQNTTNASFFVGGFHFFHEPYSIGMTVGIAHGSPHRCAASANGPARDKMTSAVPDSLAEMTWIGTSHFPHQSSKCGRITVADRLGNLFDGHSA